MSDGNEGVLCIPQSSSITGTSQSDCWVSYSGHSLEGLAPLQRCSQCILQPQPTVQGNERVLIFAKISHYWNLTIRLFSVISRTLIRGSLSLCREADGVFYSLSWLGKWTRGRRWRRDRFRKSKQALWFYDINRLVAADISLAYKMSTIVGLFLVNFAIMIYNYMQLKILSSQIS